MSLLALLISALAAIAATLADSPAAAVETTKYPCAFIDTVNISGNYPLGATNRSYVHDWMIIPHELVAVYDFVIINGVRLSAEPHLRACVCKLKPCIRFCCSPGLFYDANNKVCSNMVRNNATDVAAADQRSMDVVLTNGSLSAVNTATHFTVHIGTPCERMRFITVDSHVVHWTLHANGTVLHKNHLFSKHYCFTPWQASNATWEWQPVACAPEKLPFVLGIREWTFAICLIIAVICMAVILIVYLLSKEMRNTFYGVAIKAYSLSVVLGYSLLAHVTLTDPAHISKFACANIPCYIVLFLLLSFYILSFVSFSFYLNFHGVILTKFVFWLVFIPVVLFTLGWSFYVGHIRYGGKPVFNADICWFDPRNWSIMVYLYAPIFVACAISGLFYVLTLIRISERRESNTQKLKSAVEHNRFKSFWSFFGYTFAALLVWTCSFAVNYYRGERAHINYAVCLFTALHGFGALYALIGQNLQIQNCLQRSDEEIEDDDIAESSVPMTSF